MYQQMKFRVRSVCPLLMHNGQLSDPLNKWAKALKKISGKRGKTDDDFAEMARIEFLGGLYTNKAGEPVLPGELIEATIVAGAKKKKKGPAAKAGIIVDGNAPLVYKGPKTAEELCKDESFRNATPVKVQQNRVVRTRPQFDQWECEFTVHYLPDQVDAADVRDWVEIAGRVCGFGDWRPRFGRFEVVEVAA
jgi:hypothetical protein